MIARSRLFSISLNYLARQAFWAFCILFGLFVWALIMGFIIANMPNVVSVRIYGTTIIQKVVGPSMEPTLYSGDLVVLLPPRNLQVGDMIVFRTYQNGREITTLHRIVARHGPNCFWTKGDNNATIDHCPACDVFGKVATVIPIGAFLRNWIQPYTFDPKTP